VVYVVAAQHSTTSQLFALFKFSLRQRFYLPPEASLLNAGNGFITRQD